MNTVEFACGAGSISFDCASSAASANSFVLSCCSEMSELFALIVLVSFSFCNERTFNLKSGNKVTGEIINIDDFSGHYKKGSIEAILNIDPDLWFFKYHFKEDPVMPGCLGLDAMWQLVGFFLAWTGEPGKGRALGVNSVKFTGEVLTNVKIARYQVDMKRILNKEGATVGLANGSLYADGKIIYEAENLKVGLFTT